MMDNPCEVNVSKCDILLSESYRIVICYQSNEVSVTEVRKQVTNRCILNTLTGKLVYVCKPWSVSCGDTLLIFLIINPTRCTNFSNLFLEWNSTCFGQFLCPSSGVFHCTQQWYMSYRFADSLWAGSGWNEFHIPLLCVQWKSHDGQRNSLKHVEFHSKNKFEKLVHLIAFIIWKCPLLLPNFNQHWNVFSKILQQHISRKLFSNSRPVVCNTWGH
jgi:hypothetical protein